MRNLRAYVLWIFLLLIVKYQAAAQCQHEKYDQTDYNFCTPALNQTDAQKHCDDALGMALVIMNSSAEFQHWQNYQRSKYPTTDIWLGASFSKSRDAFVWDDGLAVPTSFFYQNPPNTAGLTDGMCVLMNVNHTLEPADCTQTFAFLCQDRRPVVASYEFLIPFNCWCSCDPADIPQQQKELDIYVDRKIAGIQDELLVDKQILSKTKRKKYSVEDDRISAQSLGWLGVVTLFLVMLIVVWMDARFIRSFINSVNVSLKNKLA